MSDPAAPAPGRIRVLTWNLFHGQDGARLGPTLASTLLRRPVDDGSRVHLNRRWTDEMARLIARRRPTVAALQEVPPDAVERIAALTGMRAHRSLMRPLVGPLALRGRLARANPDLWQTHEGTANVLLVPPDWECAATWTLRHTPPAVALREGGKLRLNLRERVHWVAEPRRLIGGRFRLPDGAEVTLVSLHCHNSLNHRVIAAETRRVLDDLAKRVGRDDAVIVAGDFNARGAGHPALVAMVDAGFAEAGLDDLDLDHIFHRGLRCTGGPATVPSAVRELPIRTAAGARVVVLSDHDIVEATYAVG